MSLIEWLESDKNIKLGKIRAGIKKDDIIIVKGLSDKTDSRFGEQLHKIFLDNLIILLPNGVTLEKLDEREMNRAGWIRKWGI